ncbi:MAG: hypothetical protein JRI23_18120 [Deltaproteobacteria bacterium]|jgi:hypothetical protein|nr:hypothetical protein [Deltaproteobacteria bacterium]MBW2533763.1 hypothetical protein [Deltaproteobacteria bacterium]
MWRRVRGILRPDGFHGALFAPPFFEGWYVKLVDRLADERLALIFGAIDTERAGDRHAFLQVFDGKRGTAANLRFDRGELSASESVLDVTLGGAHLTERAVTLDLARDPGSLRGRIEFGPLHPWPISLRAPGAMGWYAWMPFMECYHGVVSMDHELRGHLEWAGRRYDFDGGRGYLEKDWGRAFPSSWIWMQSNHFGEPGVSLMGSLARIPWIGRSFAGFIVGLLYQRKLYRFATYTGAKTERIHVAGDDAHWVIYDRRHELEIRAHRGQTSALAGPTLDGMERTVDETLSGRIEVRLARRGWRSKVVFEGTGEPAGMEMHGDFTELGAQPS